MGRHPCASRASQLGRHCTSMEPKIILKALEKGTLREWESHLQKVVQLVSTRPVVHHSPPFEQLRLSLAGQKSQFWWQSPHSGLQKVFPRGKDGACRAGCCQKQWARTSLGEDITKSGKITSRLPWDKWNNTGNTYSIPKLKSEK